MTTTKRGGWTNPASAANGRTSKRGGGRPRTNLKLDQATAHRLKILTRQRQMITPAATEETIVAELVGGAFEELETEYQDHATADMSHSQPLG